MNEPSEQNPDPLLGVLVRICRSIADSSDGRLEQGVTLQMGGLLVSGLVVSLKEYLLSHAILDMVDEVREVVMKEVVDEADVFEDPERFIHLKNAQFHSPGQLPIPSLGEGTFWRGRIDRVDGFVVGHLNTSLEVKG